MVLALALAVTTGVAATDAAGVDATDTPAAAGAAAVPIAPTNAAALDEVSEVRGVAETVADADADAATGATGCCGVRAAVATDW